MTISNTAESRNVTRWVVPHLGYYEFGFAKHDMAVIKLELPFDHMQSVDYLPNPVGATAANVEVVGYP